MKRRSHSHTICPCGSQLAYLSCCGRWHRGEAAPDAEALMRSRYSAYVLKLEAYLLASWHASTRPASLGLDEPESTNPANPTDSTESPKWLALEVKRHETTGPDDAIVEFQARYRVRGRAGKMHETSRFVREDGRWYYLDALTTSAAARPPREAAPS